ncbi:tubulin-like doman-containing protein [Bacteroides sp. OF04-15BH]|jgi:hypothetical protein|uniref:tubulin-like doman-containing protein n=1 Tax=Bacteroides sp. OF04-15BH TaxID=2292281 RepID=UPI000E4F602F|nr:tubulin-like doman-containing protein [Bacteroides sp. OF04-15BH]RHP65344.1 hypothetical protein DXA74_06050 [Bacteroides sp. OF04-15BH]
MANHLIIGLGGTGGKVLRELRKRIYEEFRSNEPGNGVFIDYVYVDSSPSDLEDRSGWNVLGKSVHLGAAQKVNINGISTSVLSNINMYPGLKGFLNPNDLQIMQEEMGSLISAGIGGQRRRLGRTLIANNISDRNNPSNFEQIVRGAVGRLQNASGNQDVTFHICAGLAGGTGSGSIIDAISQIRTWFPYQADTRAFKMRLFLYTPERTLVSARHDAGFYQANGYAALLELNALSIGQYHPTDVRGEQDIFTGEIRRLLENQEAFEAAYIYTNVNEQGKVLDLNKGLPAAVADFIFQTTIASEMGGTNGQLNRLVGCENEGSAPEKDQSGKNAHSRKFLSFGITRVEFPETEIREYMTYNYALQAARQMTYNMWQDGIGFGERSMEEVGIGFADEIKDKKNRESLMLSNNYLTLAKPIVESPATKKWRLFEETWENRTQADADDVMSTVETKLWLTDFSKRCEEFFSNQFRQHGVVGFYKIQQQERKGYARIIRRHIEKKLFDEWVSGAEKSKSILEIEKYTKLLIDDCNSRISAFENQKALMEEEQGRYGAEITEINKIWKDCIGPLQKLVNKHIKAFSEFKVAKCNYYSTATRAIAYGYAKELLQDVIEELERMLQGILAFRDELNAINEEALQEAASKCISNELQSDTDIKKYDPEMVYSICRTFISDRGQMTSTAAAIRSRMVANIGEDGERTFANLFDKTDYESAINIVLEECQDTAVRNMQDAAKNDPLSKMVGVNIMEKLKTELNTDEKIEQFVKMVAQTSKSYVQFDQTERNMVIAGNVGAMMQMVQVALPKSDERTNDFRQRLIDAFMKEIPGFDPSQDVAENYKENQIVVISANSGFPLRFLANVKTAKEKYDALVSKQNAKCALNTMVLHTESFKNELPDLYEESAETIKQKIVKSLMLAYALGIIAEQQDPTTQARFDALRIPDETFGDTWQPLGKGFVESWDAISGDFKLAQLLKEQVQKELQSKARSNDQKAVIRKALGGVVQNKILPSSLCENNQFNPNYAKFRNLAIEIISEELQDL